nr:immunoglobulin light chain junction region [Macaca mulatta]
CLQYNTKPWTF